jgi:hypothetical protein
MNSGFMGGFAGNYLNQPTQGLGSSLLPGVQVWQPGGGVSNVLSGNAGTGLGLPNAPFAQQPGVGGGIFSKMGQVFQSPGFQSGLSTFGQLANMYTGFKALGLAKDELNFRKKSFNKNFNAAAKDYENTLKDRWAANANSATARGQSFAGMNEWVQPRTIQTSGKGG